MSARFASTSPRPSTADWLAYVDDAANPQYFCIVVHYRARFDLSLSRPSRYHRLVFREFTALLLFLSSAR